MVANAKVIPLGHAPRVISRAIPPISSALCSSTATKLLRNFRNGTRSRRRWNSRFSPWILSSCLYHSSFSLAPRRLSRHNSTTACELLFNSITLKDIRDLSPLLDTETMFFTSPTPIQLLTFFSPFFFFIPRYLLKFYRVNPRCIASISHIQYFSI